MSLWTFEMPDAPILIVAYPGHELRLFHWMERFRPVVFVLTDGSGGAGVGRIDYSRRTVAAAGARAGSVFGRMPDKAWYAALLARDPTPFHEAVAAITMEAAACPPALVVSDAMDGYNPMHDLCEAVGRAVASKLAEYGPVPRHLRSPAVAGVPGVSADLLMLDAAAAARKRAAVEAYAPLAEETRALLSAEPLAMLRECLLDCGFGWPPGWVPAWERTARERVRDGCYETPLGYDAHVRPVALALVARPPA
jgi:hypothetical protein